MKRHRLPFMLLAGLLMPLAQGQQVGESVTTPYEVLAQNAKGIELRDKVAEAVTLIRQNKFSESERKLQKVQKKYEASFDRSLLQYSFLSQLEFDEFKASAPAPFEWIDWGYKQCLQMQAFIASEHKDFNAALAILEKVEALAPVSADTAAERGYALNAIGNAKEALAAYERAFALATRYPSQETYRGAALRGIGFSLIELHQLDEAESRFKQSLELEPDNQVALNELAYIEKLRAKQ